MAGRRVLFKQADVSRAVKGALVGGMQVSRVEVGPDGRIVVVATEAAMPASDNPFDRWKAKRDARPA